MSEVDVEAFRDFERRGWELIAGNYTAATATTTVQSADALLDAARVQAGSTVLDVACGPGHVAARAAERGAVASGADLAAAMVDIARREHPDIEFVVAPAEQLPHGDGASTLSCRTSVCRTSPTRRGPSASCVGCHDAAVGSR